MHPQETRKYVFTCCSDETAPLQVKVKARLRYVLVYLKYFLILIKTV